MNINDRCANCGYKESTCDCEDRMEWESENGVMVVDVKKKAVSGWCKAKNFRKQFAELKRVTLGKRKLTR